jgi:heat-inducible transcriptional repressor
LTRDFSEKVSAATIRNVMADLEYLGLLGSPHTSAGRIPTQTGLRMFVDGLLEVTDLTQDDRVKLDQSTGNSSDVGDMLDRVSTALSGVTQGASLVLAPKHEAPVKHIEFVSLSPDRALVVLVFADGHVENRLFTPPIGQTPSSMREAANFLNAIMAGHTLVEARKLVEQEIKNRRQELDSLAQDLVETGMVVWENSGERNERLIVRGRSNLIGDDPAEAELDRIKNLFDDLERKRDIADFLELTQSGDGVRIFIGSENKLFSLSGSSLVVSPYMNAERQIIGAVGVIGPTRLNYGRIVPIVDYTAQLVGKLIADRR